MITLSEKTDTTFSDIPILMIGDNCFVHSPQLLLFKMYVLFLLESPSWAYSIHSASQLIVCCQVKLVKSWSRWSNWSKVGQVGEQESEVAGHKLVKSRWNINWSKDDQRLVRVVKHCWKKCYKLVKLVTSWSGWKVCEKLVTLVKVGGFVKSWSIWSSLWKNWRSWWMWPGAGQVGDKLVKLVKNW